jgi:hypothetical protein
VLARRTIGITQKDGLFRNLNIGEVDDREPLIPLGKLAEGTELYD